MNLHSPSEGLFTLINRIKLLKNIGTFDSVSEGAKLLLSQLTLIYGENGRGKTALAAVLRSLGTGDPAPVLERKRLGAKHPPEVVIESDIGTLDAVFKDGQWKCCPQKIHVFDDMFIDRNICSGLEVGSSHRENLHGVVIGPKGVELNEKIRRLIDRVEEHNRAIRKSRQAILPFLGHGNLTVDQFCSLEPIPDIDDKIREMRQKIDAHDNSEEVLARPELVAFELPDLNIPMVRGILRKSLPDLELEAEEQIKDHIAALGTGGEKWISDGMRYVANHAGDGDCPFCGQDMSGSALLGHYRAYFSQAYSQLKEAIGAQREEIMTNHGSTVRITFEQKARSNSEQRSFWANYTDVPELSINTTAINSSWAKAVNAIDLLLARKVASPLEPIELDEQTLVTVNAYRAQRDHVLTVDRNIEETNKKILDVKQGATNGDIQGARDALVHLKEVKRRHAPGVAELCETHLGQLDEKRRTEHERNLAQDDLDSYTAEIFDAYQEGINRYLKNFNCGFELVKLTPVGDRYARRVNYSIGIHGSSVPVGGGSLTPAEPSFGNTLSAGDRMSIALAFFFESVRRLPDLNSTVVVLDDPISSLDAHRTSNTVDEILQLTAEAGQVIVMSHNNELLCSMWGKTGDSCCTALEIARFAEGSTLSHWDVAAKAEAEHDRRHSRLLAYTQSSAEDRFEVARSIRPHLERYLRTVCPGEFPAGSVLGEFVNRCRQRQGTADPILNESRIGRLDKLVKYANRFHHDTNRSWQTELINDQELLGFVQGTLHFTGP